MSLDSKILELRLLLKDSTITLPSITRVANKLQALGKDVNDNAVLESFLREVMAYQLEFEKSSNTFLALDRQKDEYTELESKIESDVTAVKASIQELEEELRQQQILRAHRIECEHLAADVNKLTSRSTLKIKIDVVYLVGREQGNSTSRRPPKDSSRASSSFARIVDIINISQIPTGQY